MDEQRSLVKIGHGEIEQIFYRDMPVLTCKQVALAHGTTEENVSRTFRRHSDEFVEGEDFYRLDFEAIKSLGLLGREILPSELLVFTEAGYLLLVKPMRDKPSWRVQREMRAGYFRDKKAAQVSQTEEWKIAFKELTTYLGPAIANKIAEATAEVKAEVLKVDENLRITIDQQDHVHEQRVKEAVAPLQRAIEEMRERFEASETIAAGPPSPPRVLNTCRVFIDNHIAMLGDEAKYLPLPLFRSSFEAHMRHNYVPVSNGSDEPAYDQEDLKVAYETPGFGTRKNQHRKGDERLSAEIASFRQWYTEQKQKTSSSPMPRAVKPPLVYKPRDGHGKESA